MNIYRRDTKTPQSRPPSVVSNSSASLQKEPTSTVFTPPSSTAFQPNPQETSTPLIPVSSDPFFSSAAPSYPVASPPIASQSSVLPPPKVGFVHNSAATPHNLFNTKPQITGNGATAEEPIKFFNPATSTRNAISPTKFFSPINSTPANFFDPTQGKPASEQTPVAFFNPSASVTTQSFSSPEKPTAIFDPFASQSAPQVPEQQKSIPFFSPPATTQSLPTQPEKPIEDLKTSFNPFASQQPILSQIPDKFESPQTFQPSAPPANLFDTTDQHPSTTNFFNPFASANNNNQTLPLPPPPVASISSESQYLKGQEESLPAPPETNLSSFFAPVDFFNSNLTNNQTENKSSAFASYFSSPPAAPTKNNAAVNQGASDIFNKSIANTFPREDATNLEEKTVEIKDISQDLSLSSKLECLSVSDKLGSQLSLFATSEFIDDSLAHGTDKSTVNTSLTISNYLQKVKDQPPETPATSRLYSQASEEIQDSSLITESGGKIFNLTKEELLNILENPGEKEIDVMAALDNLESLPSPSKPYRPVYHHWFYETAAKSDKWVPLSMSDSLAIDEAFLSKDSQRNIIQTDGGRFDVNVEDRKRYTVYWNAEATAVRRCSWFYQSSDMSYVPYDEETAERLEKEYEEASISNSWHRKVELTTGDMVMFHEPSVIVHFYKSQVPDIYATATSSVNRPRVVKRGVDSFNIEEGECEKIDHLIFMVHGIGSVCDLQFRTVEQVVDTFRASAFSLIQSHYKTSYEQGTVGRIEILPISWYNALHSEETGIDPKLKSITLESIPKLRSFTNETLLDILFYSSPRYCQVSF